MSAITYYEAHLNSLNVPEFAVRVSHCDDGLIEVYTSPDWRSNPGGRIVVPRNKNVTVRLGMPPVTTSHPIRMSIIFDDEPTREEKREAALEWGVEALRQLRGD